jgi:hypothetical protein
MTHFTETTIPLDSLPRPGKLPHVPGIALGDVVTGHKGRRMRVTRTDEWVICGDRATGPYCHLVALDDCKAVSNVIWPRSWYAKRGESLELFA